VIRCVKNCASTFHHAIGTSSGFHDEMVNLASGKKGWEIAELALKLVQQWGVAFKNQTRDCPLFFSTYEKCQSKGLKFPDEGFQEQQSAPVFTPPNTTSSSHQPTDSHPPSSSSVTNMGEGTIISTTTPPSSSPPSNVDIPPPSYTSTFGDEDNLPQPTNQPSFDKLTKDLGEVDEKITLCRLMLPESPGIENDETLSELIGFLEACRDRMVDVVEAGTMGMLDETLLATSLAVNDRLLRTLEAERV